MADQFLPNIFGAYDTRDNLNLRIEDYTEEQATEDINRFRDRFNAVVDDTTSLLSTSGTEAKTRFETTGGGEMQPYVEKGQTEATRGGEGWDVAYPILPYRDRQIYTEQFLRTATLGDLNKDVVMSAIRNATTRYKIVLRALMLKTNYSFNDTRWPGLNLGTLAVKRLFNNDGASGSLYVDATSVSIGTLQHYITSGASSIANDDFGAARDKLKNVGLGDDTVYLMGRNLGDDVRGLSDFVPTNEPNIVDPDAVYSVVRNPRAIGRIRNADGDGEVIVMPYFPDNYFIAIDRAAPQPVRRRLHPDARYQGWQLVQNETLAPYGEAAIRNKLWEFIEGAGVNNRANGVCVQISSNGTYTDPTI